MLNDALNKIKQSADLAHVNAIKTAGKVQQTEAMVNCTDIYAGLSRLISLKLPYVLLTNTKQYQIMCLPDRWIDGKPIVNHNGSLTFDYTVGGEVYHIQSSPKGDGTALFFVVGE